MAEGLLLDLGRFADGGVGQVVGGGDGLGPFGRDLLDLLDLGPPSLNVVFVLCPVGNTTNHRGLGPRARP